MPLAPPVISKFFVMTAFLSLRRAPPMPFEEGCVMEGAVERDNVMTVYESMQSMLRPMAVNAEAASSRASEFWLGQQKLLDSMQAFAGGWFERRKTGTRAALESAQRICAAKTPADAMREYQEWANGSLQRMADDGAALQRQMMQMTEALMAASPAPTPAMPRPADTAPTPAHSAQRAAD
jgi:hypothetical protein